MPLVLADEQPGYLVSGDYIEVNTCILIGTLRDARSRDNHVAETSAEGVPR